MRNIKIILLFLLISVYIFPQESLKVLHLSFHSGCIKDFEEVAQYLPINLTSWYIHSGMREFDDKGNGIYNIGHTRAERIWKKHKDFFNEFDVIVTSDTAPLSRIFLQNNWNKPLIIWVCNRFDYYDSASLDCVFPDKEYYDLFKKAITLPNVKIISYTPYEHYYAQKKGINWGNFTIKPIGFSEDKLCNSFKTALPGHIDKNATIFVHPRLESWGLHPGKQFNYIQEECNRRGVTVYSGPYNGPDDIKDFKGVIFFPYQWSNLAFFENIQRGIIHFVPSQYFIKNLIQSNKPVTCNFSLILGEFELCEWYLPEYKDLFVYFDSWDDLKNKIETTDYDLMHKKIKEFAKHHQETMLASWQMVFDTMKSYLSRVK